MTSTIKKTVRKIIQIGDVYGDLTVSTREPSINRHTVWGCRCAAGHTFPVFDRNLKTGATKWCKTCLLSGGARSEKFGKLTLCRRHEASPHLTPLRETKAGEFPRADGTKTKRGHILCLRGSSFVAISRADLENGKRPNIGTKRRSSKPKNPAVKQAHRCLYDLKRRCDDSRHPDYAGWGGRGITYDPHWKSEVIFIAEMGLPRRGQSLHRIDRNGHYCWKNCKWATDEEQNAPGARRSPNSNPEDEIVLPYEDAVDASRKLLYTVVADDGITI